MQRSYYISNRPKEYWNLKQIAGHLELDKKIKISTETTYRFVLQDKAVGGALYKYLHQHKKCRKRYGKNDYQDRILINHIDINEYPVWLSRRTRIGN
ncbi:hypothetical protein THERMOT_1065 [Bathymodiolus thermophilus thioautotrophic gill symbiont]|nr:hypothetical protein THERMOT_1065 [Bathymodiolus thermophilus thioautotrophic gill symbiont]